MRLSSKEKPFKEPLLRNPAKQVLGRETMLILTVRRIRKDEEVVNSR
jgi:hypothetical protein